MDKRKRTSGPTQSSSRKTSGFGGIVYWNKFVVPGTNLSDAFEELVLPSRRASLSMTTVVVEKKEDDPLQPSREEGLLSVLPESILCSILLWVVRCARTWGPRGRRLVLETTDTISDARIMSSSWEEFRTPSSGRVFVLIARWSTTWRRRWTCLFPDLAKELRLSGDYVGGLSVAATALWASRVVLDDEKRAALFAEIAACRLAAHHRSQDQKPARFALRDACRSLEIDEHCAAGHAAKGGALVTFGRHSDAADAFRTALDPPDDDDDLATVGSSEEEPLQQQQQQQQQQRRRGLCDAEKIATREALAETRKLAEEARFIELELCLAEFGDRRIGCTIRSDAPLRELLANINLQNRDTTALFVVTDDLEIPSDFWQVGDRSPQLRSVRYLDPDSTPDHAAFQPGNVASLKPGTRVFCGWPSSSGPLADHKGHLDLRHHQAT